MYSIHYLSEIDSTNNFAKKLSTTKDAVIIAASQTGGRGRHGRIWYSPKGNIYLSILKFGKFQPDKILTIPLITGVAIAKLLKDKYDLDTKLKWPNDILVNGKKLCGILIELIGNRLVIGIGINLNPIDNNLDLIYPTTSLKEELANKSFDIDKLYNQLISSFDESYLKYSQDNILLQKKWNEVAYAMNSKIEIHIGAEIIKGTFRGVDNNGNCLVESNLSMRSINSADRVTFLSVNRPKILLNA